MGKFEDMQELEGEFFDLSQGECLENYAGYMTICYGLDYDYKSSYFLTFLYTEESDGKIDILEMTQDVFYDCQEDIQKSGDNYPNPGRTLIERVFEFEWGR